MIGEHIRDFLVNYDILEKLPTDKRARVRALMVEYKTLPYVDARTELGPDQARRMTLKQKTKMYDTMVRVFGIESEIKNLMKSEELINQEKLAYRIKELESIILQSARYINFVVSMKTSYLKNGNLKKSYKIGVDYEQQKLDKALKELKSVS